MVFAVFSSLKNGLRQVLVDRLGQPVQQPDPAPGQASRLGVTGHDPAVRRPPEPGLVPVHQGHVRDPGRARDCSGRTEDDPGPSVFRNARISGPDRLAQEAPSESLTSY